MNIRNFYSITWIPLLSYWTIIFSIFYSYGSQDIERIVPLVFYVIVSSLLVIQFQKEITNKKRDMVIKVSMANSLLICFIVSSLSILLYVLLNDGIYISIIFIISPLIINLISSELLFFSNRQLIQGNAERSKERNESILIRKRWKEKIREISFYYKDHKDIQHETVRIGEIVEFSSFFRKKEASNSLTELEKLKDKDQILLFLRNIR